MRAGTTAVTASAGSTFELQSGTVNVPLVGTGIVANKTTTGTVVLNAVNTYTGATILSDASVGVASILEVLRAIEAHVTTSHHQYAPGNGEERLRRAVARFVAAPEFLLQHFQRLVVEMVCGAPSA